MIHMADNDTSAQQNIRLEPGDAAPDFTLTAEDMAAIEALDGGESLFFSHYDPKTVEWFMSIL